MDPTLKKFFICILLYFILLNYQLHINYIIELINFDFKNSNNYTFKYLNDFFNHYFNAIILIIIFFIFIFEVYFIYKLKKNFILSNNFKNIVLHLSVICLWLDLDFIIGFFELLTRMFYILKPYRKFIIYYNDIPLKTLPLFYIIFLLIIKKKRKNKIKEKFD